MEQQIQGYHDLFGEGIDHLHCPRCGAESLHQGEVIVYDRSEDQKTCVKTSVNAGQVSVDPKASNALNPSSRRHGLTIQFACEKCGDAPIILKIAQHKGSTRIGWAFQHVPLQASGAFHDSDLD